VFLITAGIYLVGAILYGLLASGERQDWSRIPGEHDEFNFDATITETESIVSNAQTPAYGSTPAGKFDQER
jgi:hypothetical protein